MDKQPRPIRTQPVQQRSLDTMELVLDTAAALLEELGTDAVTTKLIATRAGIRVRSVYRYFSNKQAIIHELARRMALAQTEYIRDFDLLADPRIPWREALDRTLPDKRGDIQLTDAIKLLIRMGEPVYAWLLNPDQRRYDVGNFESYFRTFIDFSLADERYGYLVRKYIKAKAYDL